MSGQHWDRNPQSWNKVIPRAMGIRSFFLPMIGGGVRRGWLVAERQRARAWSVEAKFLGRVKMPLMEKEKVILWIGDVH